MGLRHRRHDSVDVPIVDGNIQGGYRTAQDVGTNKWANDASKPDLSVTLQEAWSI
jgi:hypothetical protein